MSEKYDSAWLKNEKERLRAEYQPRLNYLWSEANKSEYKRVGDAESVVVVNRDVAINIHFAYYIDEYLKLNRQFEERWNLAEKRHADYLHEQKLMKLDWDYISDQIHELYNDYTFRLWEKLDAAFQAKNLVELADVLNSYTDIFQNGSEWYVG